MKIRRAIRVIVSLALAAIGTFALRWTIPWGAPLESEYAWGSTGTGHSLLRVSFLDSSLHIAATTAEQGTEDEFWTLGTSMWTVVPSWQYFEVYSSRIGGHIHRGIIVPIWFVALISLPYPILMLRSEWKLLQRKRRGHCLKCGYDLMGNVTGKCPECGTAFQPKSTSSSH